MPQFKLHAEDQQNLKFLLSLDSKGMERWYAATTPADHEYASELMHEYSEWMKACSRTATLMLDYDFTMEELESARQVIDSLK